MGNLARWASVSWMVHCMILVSNVHYQYPGADMAALNGIDLTINTGELFGLLGPNGAGKSTLISMLIGLRKPDSGTIQYGDRDVVQHRNQLQKEIAWVPQEYAFYPSMTVVENLRFFAGVLGLGGRAGRDRITDVIAVTGLENAGSKRAAQFSGGMKRRLNVAIALLSKPSWLFLDEPTVGIDPQSRHFILESIRRISASGTTVIYSSHYMEEVEALCDRIAIIDQGRVLMTGSLAELLANDAQLTEGSANAARLTIRIAEPVAGPLSLKSGFRLSEDRQVLESDRINPRALGEQLQAIDAAGGRIANIHCGTGNLEQLFLSLTHRSLRD